MCIFGSHPENPRRCRLVTVTKGKRAGTHEELEIAELGFRQHCAVACVNGEFDESLFPKSNVDLLTEKALLFLIRSHFAFVNLARESSSNPRNAHTFLPCILID